MIKVLDGWTIELNPKPIGDRSMDWDFSHSDHDGTNGLSGTGSSIEDCINQIEEMEAGQ